MGTPVAGKTGSPHSYIQHKGCKIQATLVTDVHTPAWMLTVAGSSHTMARDIHDCSSRSSKARPGGEDAGSAACGRNRVRSLARLEYTAFAAMAFKSEGPGIASPMAS